MGNRIVKRVHKRLKRNAAKLSDWLDHKSGRATKRPTAGSCGHQSVLPVEAVPVQVQIKESEEMKLEQLWTEQFDGDLSNWNQDDQVVDPLHRAGYEHLELDGSVNTDLDHIKVPGRWAALMDEHRDKVHFIRDGKLVLKGHVEHVKNPYRKNFADQHHGDLKLYGPWISNWGSKWSEEHKRHITDWSRTKLPLLGPGTVLEVKVNLEKQCMGGGRFSIWKMCATATEDTPDTNPPAKTVRDEHYNDDPSVMEIDLIEVENPFRFDADFGQTAFMKCIGGAAGDTKNGHRNLLKDFGIDLRKGWHTLKLVHHKDGTLDFVCDDQVINHEPRSVTAYGYVILSCEFNSGCKDPELDAPVAPHEYLMDGPHQPRDPGLSARSYYNDIDLIDDHEVLVDHITAYKIL